MTSKLMVIALLFTNFILGMSNERSIIRKTPDEASALFSHKNLLIASIAKWLKPTNEGSKIYVANTFFTNPTIVKALEKAKTRGARVEIIIDQDGLAMATTEQQTLENLQALQNIGIDATIYNLNKKKVTPFDDGQRPQTMHLKMICWKELGEDTANYRVISGTANLSGNAENKNWEHITFLPNNKELYQQTKKLLKSLALGQATFSNRGSDITKGKLTVQKVFPAKIYPPLTSAITTLMVASPAQNPLAALTNLINATQQDDVILISCYSISEKTLVDALKNAAQRRVKLEIITDRICCKNTTAKTRLKELSGTLPLFVYNADEGSNHHKFVLCQMKGKNPANWVVEGSCNFTFLATVDVNELIFHRNNAALLNAFAQAFVETRKKAMTYQAYQARIDEVNNFLADQFSDLHL